MAYNKTVNFTIVPAFSLRQSATTTQCTITIFKDDCNNRLVCNAAIPVLNQQFVMPQGASNTTQIPAKPTNTSMPEEQGIHLRVCLQNDSVWESEKTHRGILKVKVYNFESVSTCLDLSFTYLIITTERNEIQSKFTV